MNITSGSAAALLATMLVLSAAPGPGDAAVVAESISAGLRRALQVVAGIIVADFVFILCAVYGLAAAAELLGPLFTIVRYACAAYLVRLGVLALRAPPRALASESSGATGMVSGFATGFAVTLGDPKAILFYASLLPAFADVTRFTLLDTIVVMAIAAVSVATVKITYAYLARRAGSLLESVGVSRKLDQVAGALLLATGVFLAVMG